MRVKHWQGYGSVNVKKISRTVKDNVVNLHLQVRGNHEWGIASDDTYDVVRWIGNKCDKKLTDYKQITNLKLDERWDGAAHEDVCDYYITYEEAAYV